MARSYSMGARADAVSDTQDRILTAATALFLEQAFEEVTLAGIAEASGVSHQTVLNHFGSKIGVVVAVADRLKDSVLEVRRAEPGDVAGAIKALVADYETMGDANVRWVAASERVPELVTVLDGAREAHQSWLRAMFLPDPPGDARATRRTVNALHVATDVGSWKLLRRELRLSRAETERTMTELVTAILERGTP